MSFLTPPVGPVGLCCAYVGAVAVRAKVVSNLSKIDLAPEKRAALKREAKELGIITVQGKWAGKRLQLWRKFCAWQRAHPGGSQRDFAKYLAEKKTRLDDWGLRTGDQQSIERQLSSIRKECDALGLLGQF